MLDLLTLNWKFANNTLNEEEELAKLKESLADPDGEDWIKLRYTDPIGEYNLRLAIWALVEVDKYDVQTVTILTGFDLDTLPEQLKNNLFIEKFEHQVKFIDNEVDYKLIPAIKECKLYIESYRRFLKDIFEL